jgi:hypothetical protein
MVLDPALLLPRTLGQRRAAFARPPARLLELLGAP